MKALSPRMILVTGHSDKSGNSSFNLSLSQKRAERVAAILMEEGIQADRIKVKGLGEELARGTYNAKERNVVIQAVLDR